MTAEQKTKAVTAKVTLEAPIIRGEQTISELVLRKPRAGELRGLSLTEVMQMKVDAIATLLPRITQPTLIANEIDAMEPADLMACAMEVAVFLAPKRVMESDYLNA